MLTANQPWSGWYGVRGPAGNPAATDMPVVWATAHVTQFAKVVIFASVCFHIRVVFHVVRRQKKKKINFQPKGVPKKD